MSWAFDVEVFRLNQRDAVATYYTEKPALTHRDRLLQSGLRVQVQKRARFAEEAPKCRRLPKRERPTGGAPHFNGPDYVPSEDWARLTKQHDRVRDCALLWRGEWFTLAEIARATKDPEASVSAQLRHLRKERFGSFVVDKRPRGDRSTGLFEYRVRRPIPTLTQMELF